MISYESNKIIIMVLDYIYIMPAAMSKSVNKANELFCKKPEQKLPEECPFLMAVLECTCSCGP